MAPTLSILIVSHNTRDLTLACLESIAAETRATSYEVIVVDNASIDGSSRAVASKGSGAQVLALDQNVGFGRANHLAAEHAKGELLLLLNPDTVVLDGAIDELVAFARRRPQAMIWGGRTLFADGRLNPSSAWGRMTLWRLFCRLTGLTSLAPRSSALNGEAMGGWQRDSVREVDIVSGCFLMLSKTLWKRLGGFDPVFFMYGEDADLCLRARALGARPAITPAATIEHLGGASEATREGKMVKLLAAKATLIDRHSPRMSRSVGLALNALWPLSRWLALGLSARLMGDPETAGLSEEWHRIWRRRAEWQRGWGCMPSARTDVSLASTDVTPAATLT